MSGQAPALLWAPRAWVEGRWRASVVFEIDRGGRWSRIAPDTPPAQVPDAALRLHGPALPGLVNAHSHAFQRAFASLAERLNPERGARDDFWSWRDRMYAVALRITPRQLRAVATHLYAELLQGGYTQVCEFHYLQHNPEGRPYDDPAEMSRALADAAAATGIGLTLLPVLYERAGFAQATLRPDQRRFATSVHDVLALQAAVRELGDPLVDAGVAIHSLRAARPESILSLAEASSGPLHIHAAEQTAEVDDCLAATGCRPLEWLARHAPLSARWQIVHATHALPAEIEAVAASGAGIVLCPTTEANLGDGLPDLERWLAAGVPISVGSDSQVGRAWPEELRWLDYAQRLVQRRRNVAADAALPATAARLFERALAGGAAAAGFERWGFVPGARADLLEIDAAEPALAGLPPGHLLDGLVFAAPARPFARVLVAGAWACAGPTGDFAAFGAFEEAMHALWPTAL